LLALSWIASNHPRTDRLRAAPAFLGIFPGGAFRYGVSLGRTKMAWLWAAPTWRETGRPFKRRHDGLRERLRSDLRSVEYGAP